MIKAVIFDLDGVITDTAEYHYLGWKKMSEEFGLEFNREINENLRGVSRMKSLEIILKNNNIDLSDEKKLELTNKKNNYYVESLNNITEKDFLPNAKEVVLELKEKNIKTAIGSASKNAEKVLRNLKALELFDFIADGYSVKKAKPEPDLFLYAAKNLEVAPEETVVIEDAKAGIEAALNANMFAVGIGPVDRVGKAHIVYENTSKMNVQEIINIANKNKL